MIRPGGRVAIVGAGPGDPELLTRKGHRLLREADAVVFDRLVSPEIVALAVTAKRYDVGKQHRPGSITQAEIDALLVRLAREGKRVVRLKGGDPTLFSRISSELEALVTARIPFEIVPGISSAMAAPAYAGIPLTDRRSASAVAIVTATQQEGLGTPLDWAALARIPTVVVLMGAGRVACVTRALLEHGVEATRPAAAIEWGTTARQRVVHSCLGDLAGAVAGAGLGAPLTIVVGDVAALGERYAWFEGLAETPPGGPPAPTELATPEGALRGP